MRNYKRKSDRGTKSVELMQRAADLVINENKSLRQVCRDYELSKTSLSRFIKRMKNDPVNLRFGYGSPRQIFNKEQEASLTEYLLKLAQIFHGIGPKEVRRMAYDCAIKYKISVPSTWHTWMPGMCSDVFKNIEKRFEHASIKEKACVICFDEMSIMCNLEYSKKYDLIEGFEDLGGNHRTKNVAKYCLVFLIRGLYAQWKLPVAYFLSNTNVKAENLELLLKALINKLFDSGVLPKAVVCDQASTNQKVYKRLGVTSDSPFFYTNDRKIFALYDVSHLIKNIRNNFLSNDYVNGDDKMSFQDIKKTYAIDKASNVSRALTKLTERHINPNSFQKMSVSLATQIFSNSVAAAIRTVKTTNQLNSDTAIATAKFVQVVNHMFDALNSKTRYSKNPYKHALSKNSTFATGAIIDAKNIFKKLQKISYKNNKDGQKKEILTTGHHRSTGLFILVRQFSNYLMKNALIQKLHTL